MAGAVDGDDANAVSVPVLQGRGELGAFAPKAEFGPPQLMVCVATVCCVGSLKPAGSDKVALDHNTHVTTPDPLTSVKPLIWTRTASRSDCTWDANGRACTSGAQRSPGGTHNATAASAAEGLTVSTAK